ncbi:hypothetical protein AMTR_s00076p00152890 [Amborella trichopoda]|uniref:Uncharacterized protein n=1 Tax=Amborella trichopoda TaxID=13333 RepID=W1PAJ7_AMBTC|nr:hypothetical protein AMTR_s00076p00152890 [Amborella trichopoda]
MLSAAVREEDKKIRLETSLANNPETSLANRKLDYTETFWRNHMDSVKKQARRHVDQLGADLAYIAMADIFRISWIRWENPFF